MTTSNLNATLKALYKGKVFKGLAYDRTSNYPDLYQKVLNQVILDVELDLDYGGCYYESDQPAIKLSLIFNIPSKYQNTSHFDISLDTPFTVE